MDKGEIRGFFISEEDGEEGVGKISIDWLVSDIVMVDNLFQV